MEWTEAIKKSNSLKKEAKRKDNLKKGEVWIYVRLCETKGYRYRQMQKGKKARISTKYTKPPNGIVNLTPIFPKFKISTYVIH
ncbi:hypothetical protein KKA14_19715 [bacterium]|nr:hypothetical protein [bacterium]